MRRRPAAGPRRRARADEGPRRRRLVGLGRFVIRERVEWSVADEKKKDATKSGNPAVAADARAAKDAKRPKKKQQKLTTTRSWVVPTFLTLLLLGVAWLVVWYLTTSTGISVPVMSTLGNWNMLIAMVLMAGSFGVATQWK
ncbi:cell division protein CrgA [Propioniciclava coleopterorum]|uniref:Cell division protein CrgA n=1 Tax=Propioniciclava coleopterorum TaxID=2714937 RepID=A0A6G7Y711_9ACTN|nr:cell division protein CrgA [Propioniciclava coleopterorum]